MHEYSGEPREKLMPQPEVFVWTRFGTEAGQPIEDIIERKERERRDNGGVFLWGIGNNIAPSLPTLLCSGQTPMVAFSPIKSKPRAVDQSPGQVAVWRRATTPSGAPYDLPSASMVTSRYAHGKSKHFALVCRSDQPLTLNSICEAIHFESLVNAKSGSSLGFSQVTAVVRSGNSSAGKQRRYDVAIRCELAAPFVATLHDPMIITNPDQKGLHDAFQSSWRNEETDITTGQLSLQLG